MWRLASAFGAALLWSGALAMCAGPARPEPPAGTSADPEVAKFFRGLVVPGSTLSCCDESDCRFVESRFVGDGWQALITPGPFPIDKPTWVKVPPERVIQDRGKVKAAACWTPGLGLLCFTKPEVGG